jgi:hypothetical protein
MARDLEIGEVSLPELVDDRCRVGELVGCLHDDERRRRDQAARLQKPVNAGFRDEGSLAIGERDGDLARGEIGLVESERDDPLAHVIWNAVPDPVRCRTMILERIKTA